MSTNLTQLYIPLPHMLVKCLNIQTLSRYFGLHYSLPFPKWNDGLKEGTVSHLIYRTFINHIVVAIELWTYNLGSDEFEAAHHLLCDRKEQKVFIGSAKSVEHFLNAQKQLMNKADIHQSNFSTSKEYLRIQVGGTEELDCSGEWSINLEQMRRYELLLSQELENCLDQEITSELLARYLKYARTGEYRAIQQLEKYRHKHEDMASSDS